jgi:hypothetical protein
LTELNVFIKESYDIPGRYYGLFIDIINVFHANVKVNHQHQVKVPEFLILLIEKSFHLFDGLGNK